MTNAADVEIIGGLTVVNKGEAGGYKSAVTDQVILLKECFIGICWRDSLF